MGVTILEGTGPVELVVELTSGEAVSTGAASVTSSLLELKAVTEEDAASETRKDENAALLEEFCATRQLLEASIASITPEQKVTVKDWIRI